MSNSPQADVDPTSSPTHTPLTSETGAIIEAQPEPLNIIYPGEKEAPIDVENPGDLASIAKNTVDPSKRPTRVSGRIFEQKVQQKRPREFVDDTSEFDDSSDRDFEEETLSDSEDTSLASDSPPVSVPQTQSQSRKGKKKVAAKAKESEKADSFPEDVPLQRVFQKKKKAKVVGSTSEPTPEAPVEPTPEADVDPTPPPTREDDSPGDTEVAAEVLKEMRKEAERAGSPLDEGVASDVGGTSHPTSSQDEPSDDDSDSSDDWELSNYHLRFYSSVQKSAWSFYKEKKFRVERTVDEASFAEHGLIRFLESRGLAKSVQNMGEFSEKVIKEVYVNLFKTVNKVGSKRYGKVFLRNKLYDFTPAMFNSVLGTPDGVETVPEADKHEVVQFITGGILNRWETSFSPTKLTSLYTVMFKLATYNWSPTLNETTVTPGHAQLLYALGMNLPINWGEYIIRHIVTHAEKGGKGVLPFPSTIWKVLIAQGFQPAASDVITPPIAEFKVSKNHLSAEGRIKDLPWSAGPQAGEDVGADVTAPVSPDVAAPVGPTPTVPDPMQFDSANLSFLQGHLAYLDHMIASLTAERDRVRVFLSSQKGGENAGPSGVGVESVDGDESLDVGGEAVLGGDTAEAAAGAAAMDAMDTDLAQKVASGSEESEEGDFRIEPRTGDVGTAVDPTSD